MRNDRKKSYLVQLEVPLLEREKTRSQNYFLQVNLGMQIAGVSKNKAGAASSIFIADLLESFM